MKLWILGAKGQVASVLQELCLKRNIAFVATAREEVDITDLEKLKRKNDSLGCTHLVNCAAYTNVDKAEQEEKQAFAVNSLGAENIGKLAALSGIKVLHLSTDYVFNGEKRSLYLEDDQTSPLGAYGKSKREGELRLLSYDKGACVVRTSWVFGTKGKNFISSLLALLQKEKSLEVAKDQISRPTWSEELAEGVLDLLSHTGIYHFASAEPLSRFAIAMDFYQEAKRRGVSLKCQKIEPILVSSLGSYRPHYSALNTDKVEKALGRPMRSWQRVLKEYFDHALCL